MALLKAFVCQVFLLGMYKLLFEQVVEDYLVPDELTRNCVVGFVCLLCFGIQLYTENVEEQSSHGEPSKAKSRRRTPSDAADSVSEFLDERTVHMMRTLDAAIKHMNQMPMSDEYVQNVVFSAASPEPTVIEQTFVKQSNVVIEEIPVTKLDDVIYSEEEPKVFANEPIVIPVKVEDIGEEKQNDKTESEEEEEEEEIETKSDVCEEEEDVVTVIDASKPKQTDEKSKPEAVESEEEEEENEEEEVEEEKESVTADKTNEKLDEEPDKNLEFEEEDEEEESEEEQDDAKRDGEKVAKR